MFLLGYFLPSSSEQRRRRRVDRFARAGSRLHTVAVLIPSRVNALGTKAPTLRAARAPISWLLPVEW